jgi:hypothetical protein
VDPIEKVKAVFPSLEWEVRNVTTGQEEILQLLASFTLAPSPRVGCGWPIYISIIGKDQWEALVSIGETSKLAVFVSSSKQGATLNEVLAQLKQWFEQMAEVFAGVVK